MVRTRLNRRALAIGSVVFVVAIVAAWWTSREEPTESTPAVPAAPPGLSEAAGAPAAPAGEVRKPDRTDARPTVPERPAAPARPQTATAGLVRVVVRVVDGESRRAVAGVDVIFAGKGEESTTTSGASGVASIDLVPRDYRLRATGDGVYALPREVTITSGQAPIELEVYRPAIVRGTAVDENHRPIAGAVVRAFPPEKGVDAYPDDGGERSVASGPNGTFELTVVAGRVQLAAATAGGHGVLDLGVLAPGEEKSQVVITVYRLATVAGRVRSVTGEPIAGAAIAARVRVPGSPARQNHTTVTDADGRYQLDGVIGGVIMIHASAVGFADAEPQRVRANAGDHLSIDFTLRIP